MVLTFEFLDEDFLSELGLFILVRGEFGGVVGRPSLGGVDGRRGVLVCSVIGTLKFVVERLIKIMIFEFFWRLAHLNNQLSLINIILLIY